MVIQVSSHYGWTLVTDGRVDDQLVWWSWHSKLSAWSPVRVSRVTLSCLRWSGRTVTEDVQSETNLTGRDLWEVMLDGDVTHGWMAWVGSGHLGGE